MAKQKTKAPAIKTTKKAVPKTENTPDETLKTYEDEEQFIETLPEENIIEELSISDILKKNKTS